MGQSYHRASFAAIIVILLTAGCATEVSSASAPLPASQTPETLSESPSASASASDGTQPASSETEPVLTMSGIGSLQLGAPAGESDLVVFDPDHCFMQGVDLPLNDPSLARWVWAESIPAGSPRAVGLVAPNDIVAAIEVVDDAVPTDRGIRVGDTYSKFRAFYPDAELAAEGPDSTVWILRDDRLATIFEVTRDGYDDSRPEDNNVVLSILAALDAPDSYFSTRARTDYVIGGCI